MGHRGQPFGPGARTILFAEDMQSSRLLLEVQTVLRVHLTMQSVRKKIQALVAQRKPIVIDKTQVVEAHVKGSGPGTPRRGFVLERC